MNELHIIAYVYHWSRESLWDCPVSERRAWLKLILKQKEAERRAAKGESLDDFEDY